MVIDDNSPEHLAYAEAIEKQAIREIINHAKQEQKEKDAETILEYAQRNWKLSNYIYAELLAKAIRES